MRHIGFVAALGLMLLAGCASPTPFKMAETNGRDGYTVQRLEEDRYLISFSGNTSTSRQTVEAYLLYLASQVTLKGGFDYFVIQGRELDKSVEYQNDSLGFGGGFGRRHFLLGGDISTYSRPSNRYDIGGEIVLRKGKKSGDDPRAYDAHDLQEKVAPQVVRDPKEPGPY